MNKYTSKISNLKKKKQIALAMLTITVLSMPVAEGVASAAGELNPVFDKTSPKYIKYIDKSSPELSIVGSTQGGQTVYQDSRGNFFSLNPQGDLQYLDKGSFKFAGVSPLVEPGGPPSTTFVVEDYVGPGKVDAVQTSESVIDSFFDVFIDDDERIKETPGDTPEPGIFDRWGKNPEQKTENEKTVVEDSSPAGFGTGMNGSPGAGPALGGMGGMGGMNPMMGPGGRANPMMSPGGAAGPGSPMMGGAMGGRP